MRSLFEVCHTVGLNLKNHMVHLHLMFIFHVGMGQDNLTKTRPAGKSVHRPVDCFGMVYKSGGPS